MDRPTAGGRPVSAPTTTTPNPLHLGLRENLAQFSLLVGVNALVGGMIGQERTVLPLLAGEEFGLTKFTATLTFIAAFDQPRHPFVGLVNRAGSLARSIGAEGGCSASSWSASWSSFGRPSS